jgi:hypothetical protein
MDNADGELNYTFLTAYQDLLLLYITDWHLFAWTHWLNGVRMVDPLYSVRIDFWVTGGDCTVAFTDDLLINNYENLSKSWIASMLQIEESEIDAMHELRMKFLVKVKGEEFAKNFDMQ